MKTLIFISSLFKTYSAVWVSLLSSSLAGVVQTKRNAAAHLGLSTSVALT